MNEDERLPNERIAEAGQLPRPRRLASLAANVLAPTLLFYAVTLLALGGAAASLLVRDLERQSMLRIETIAQFVKADIQRRIGIAGVVAELLADNVDVAAAIAGSDEAQILAATSRRFAELKVSLEARDLSFYRIDASGASPLVRIDDPSNRRGNLATPQALINKAAVAPRGISGLEAGSEGIGLLALTPVSYGGARVGLSEVSIDFEDDYLAKLKQLYKTDFRILLKSDATPRSNYRSYAESESPGWLVAATTTHDALIPSDARQNQLPQCGDGVSEGFSPNNGQTYVVQSIGLIDIGGACVGSLQILLGDAEQISIRNSRFLTGLALLVGGLFLSEACLHWAIRRQTRAMHLLAKISHRIASGAHSDVEQITTLNARNYETFELANALQKMTRQLLDLINGLELRVREKTEALEIANTNIGTLNQQLKMDNVRMSSELDVQQRLQEMLAPDADELLRIEGLDVAAVVRPATEVAGDYYDLFRYGDRNTFAIGDVTGHGLESGVVMVMTQSILRALLTQTDAPLTSVLEQANRVLFANIERSGIDRCLSLCLVDYVRSAQPDAVANLTIVGQHETILIARANGGIEVIETDALGFPVGMIDDISTFVGETRTSLAVGDVVLLYSDGVTEAENTNGVPYRSDRLSEVLRLRRSSCASDIMLAILQDLINYCGGNPLQDDVMLVVLKQE